MKLLVLSVAVMCVMFACHTTPQPKAPEFNPHTQCNEFCNSDYDCVNSICGAHCNLNGYRGMCGNLRTP